MLDKLKQQLLTIEQTLKNKKNLVYLIEKLQWHSSYMCQSESIDDYFKETRLLLDQIDFSQDQLSVQDERILETFTNQVLLLNKISFEAPRKQSTAHKQTRFTYKQSRSVNAHQKLTQYRSYIQQFDDKIRTLHHQDEVKNQDEIAVLYQRRQRCINAIEALEKDIATIEKGY